MFRWLKRRQEPSKQEPPKQEQPEQAPPKEQVGIAMLDPDPVAEAVKRCATPLHTGMSSRDIEAEIQRLTDLKRKLLSIEIAAELELNQQVVELEYKKLDVLYRRIDMGFLRWRDKDGWPRFAVFETTSGDCRFEASCRRGAADRPEIRLNYKPRALDTTLGKHFTDVGDRLSRLAQAKNPQNAWESIASLNARFSGIIPDDTKATLKALEEAKTFRDIYIVTEAPAWELDPYAQPIPYKDPLLIGHRDGSHWLITAFDTTTAEEYVRREFTSNPKT